MKFLKKKIPINDINAYRLRGKTFYKNVLDDNKEKLDKGSYRIRSADKFECILCAGKKGKLLLEWQNGYQLFECGKCKAISANIDIQDEESHIKAIYKEDDSYCQTIMNTINKTFDYRKSVFGKERFDYCLGRLGLDISKAKVLDVGCGVGYFLSYLKDMGVDAKGLEVDPFQSRYCNEIDLNVATTELIQEKDNTYDLIVMFDVLEHLTDPIGFFNIARSKLKNNGYLIVYTPNMNSIGFELMGEKQNLLHPFQHVCFYNNDSVNYLASEVNLEIRDLEYYGLDVMDYLLMKEYEDDFPYTEKLHEFMTLMQGSLDAFQISNHIRITFKKCQ